MPKQRVHGLNFQLLCIDVVNLKRIYSETLKRTCSLVLILDSGYPHDGRADKNPYPHDRRANKDSYPHDSKNQCIILRLQLSFVMINVQLMLD